MKKLKKSLAVLLAIIMLASFTPLFASAAISLSRTNIEIVPPSVSPAEIDYGTTMADITFTGGECWYIDPDTGEKTKVEGEFQAYSTTTKPGVNDEYKPILRFYPTDTATYGERSGMLSATLTTIKSGTWPTIKVNGMPRTLVEAAKFSKHVGIGEYLSSSTLTGGKVVDANGTEITTGRWTIVENKLMETAGTYEVDIQWTATGYATIVTKTTVEVKNVKTSIGTAPTAAAVNVGTQLQTADNGITFGTVLDEDGNDVTANGRWNYTYPDGLTAINKLYSDTAITVTWTGSGYDSIATSVTIPVTQSDATYNFTRGASITESRFTYQYGYTYEDLTLVPAIITDKSGNEVKGTYSYWNNGAWAEGTNLQTQHTGQIHACGVKNGLVEARAINIKFTPDDSTLPVYYFEDYIYVSKSDFGIADDFELVLNYGAAHKTPYSGNDLRFSTVTTVPEDAGVYSIYWKKELFDPATADYGSVTYVKVSITPTAGYNYNNIEIEIPIRIQNFIHDGTNPWYMNSSSLSFSGTNEEAYDGIKNYRIDFTNTRLKGTVDLIINDEVYLSVSPDENGKFFAEGQWTAPASGEYTYRFEYKPSEEDTATVTNPVYGGGNRTFTIDLRPMHTLTIVIGNDVFTEDARVGFAAGADWSYITSTNREDFGYWVFTDENGNEFTPEAAFDGEDPVNNPNCFIIMPDHDVTATAKSAGLGGNVGEDGGLGSLWAFWQKLVDWIVSVYRMIVDFLIPTVETF